MLKMLGFCIKLVVFSILVLVLGNWFRWDGKTISDQVRVKMAHAERSDLFGVVRNWADKVTYDARKGVQRKVGLTQSHEQDEEITSSERQKLKALIQELNSSHKKD